MPKKTKRGKSNKFRVSAKVKIRKPLKQKDYSNFLLFGDKTKLYR